MWRQGKSIDFACNPSRVIDMSDIKPSSEQLKDSKETPPERIPHYKGIGGRGVVVLGIGSDRHSVSCIGDDHETIPKGVKKVVRRIPCLYLSVLSGYPDDFTRIEREKMFHFAAILLKKGGVSRLDSRNLRSNYGPACWAKMSDFMVRQKLLEIDGSYWAGKGSGKCKTYSLPPPVKECEKAKVTCSWQPRRGAWAERRAEVLSIMSQAQLYVRGAVYRLTVSADWRSDTSLSEAGQGNLKRIEDKEFFCEPDKNGRLHHNLTNMSKCARPHVRLDGRPLVGVDFSALHPNLILSLAPDGEEKTKLAAWLAEGLFYEKLAAGLAEPITRSKAKITFNAAVNDHFKREDRYPIFEVFAREFPKIADIVRRLKWGNHKNAACVLQRLESRLIFAEVIAALEKRSIPCISLHDAIFAAPEYSEEIASEMVKAAKRSLGVSIIAKAG